MRHARSVVRDAHVGLFAVPEVALRNQDVAHAQHAQASQLLGSVEHHGRETTGHFTVEPDFDSGLDLVLALDQ